ncbi:MAG: hypothetical protein KTR31_41535 [Myxococcales bacterium]|nr:hypothetical protein [Myxococcales bacterium]
MSQELSRFRAALSPIQTAAKGQPWAKERPWRTKTHVVLEEGVMVVDLHDLKANLARKAVAAVVGSGPSKAGAVVFVVGRGRRSVGPGGVLGKVVRSELGAACKSASGWSVRPVGPARIAWITDWNKAPASVVGGGGWGMWLLYAFFAAAVCVAFAQALGLFGE